MRSLSTDNDGLIARLRRVLDVEARAVSRIGERLDEAAAEAVRMIIELEGRLVLTGMGKSGHVAKKLAATFASTGTPAFFVHPAEAQHGDLGMITAQDLVLAFSYSGETDELRQIAPHLKRMGARLISVTGRPDSSLARLSDLHLCAAVEEEACPLNLAPTASTTAALALGDALAVTVLELRGFNEEDFARSHPGGSLGRRLLVRVRDVMRQDDRVPRVPTTASLAEALVEISAKRMGMTSVVDADGRAVGIFTDGDLRRFLAQGQLQADQPMSALMTPGALTIDQDALAAEAAHRMDSLRINHLLVTDSDGRLCGAIGLHDLLEAKII